MNDIPRTEAERKLAVAGYVNDIRERLSAMPEVGRELPMVRQLSKGSHRGYHCPLSVSIKRGLSDRFRVFTGPNFVEVFIRPDIAQGLGRVILLSEALPSYVREFIYDFDKGTAFHSLYKDTSDGSR